MRTANFENDKCKLYNCDCMEVLKTMEDGSVDLTLTDIPYNYKKFTSFTTKTTYNENGEKNERHIVKRRDDITESDINSLNFDLIEFLDELVRVTKKCIIVFGSLSQVSQMYDYFENLVDTIGGSVRQLVWEKPSSPLMTSMWTYGINIENFIIYRLPKAPAIKTKEKSSVFHYPAWQNKIHPTEKSHDLIAELIDDNSEKGDIVFDPCSGSGAVPFVAIRMGRKAIGVEILKDFYDKSLLRIKERGNYQYDILEDYGDEDYYG